MTLAVVACALIAVALAVALTIGPKLALAIEGLAL